MADAVENLEIRINGEAQQANDAIDRLCLKLDSLITRLGGLDGSKLVGLANGVQRLGTAMNTMNGIKTTDFSRLARNIEKIGNINTGNLNKTASVMSQIGKAFGNLGNLSQSAIVLADLVNGIKQFGYKSADKAITNIPLLANAMKDLMNTLSQAPQVSQNLIDMTNALAKLARTGASSGKAANALGNSLGIYGKSAISSRKHTFSLASAIGKLYASYWMLLRAVGLVKDSINIASDLTEVQNVVDTTFGSYSGLVEDMSKNSITEFGMSELTVKKTASRFQAMGTAMGFAKGQMAEMSIDLTKLTADMASFYNVEQDAVAEDLASIFTGQSKPLRAYGLDLTEATIAEWAMKQGMDANVSSMTQAEKALLRYNYVMANTKNAHKDFERTSDTWANQTRILIENFRALGAVVGGSFINALKPLVKALNAVMGKIIQFAKVVSDALGVIFGWKYEVGGAGSVASELADAESSAGGVSDGLGGAADNAKKLKQQLAGIDELNVLSSDSGGSGGGGSGGGGGVSDGGADTSADGGQWVETESMFESSLDTLYKLGEYIGDTLTKTLAGIDWNKIYKKAENFGSGLAQFLNGLISPELFYEVGKTISNSLNTVLYTALSFAETFDFSDFGESLAASVNGFFLNYDFASLAEGINRWVNGIAETISEFLENVNWVDVTKSIAEFFANLEIDTIGIIFATTQIKKWGILTILESAKTSLTTLISNEIGIVQIPTLSLIFANATLSGGGGLGIIALGDQILASVEEYIGENFGETVLTAMGDALTIGTTTAAGLYLGGPAGAVAGAFIGLFIDAIYHSEEISEGISKLADKTSKALDSLSENMSFHVGIFVDDIKTKISEKFEDAKKWWQGKKDSLGEVRIKISDLLKDIKELWEDIKKWWKSKPGLDDIEFSFDDLGGSIKNIWDNVSSWWSGKPNLKEISFKKEDLQGTTSTLWSKVSTWWNGKKDLKQVSFKKEDLQGSVTNLWSNTSYSWDRKKALSTVSFRLSDLVGIVRNTWTSTMSWWNSRTPLSSISFSIGSILDPIRSAVNSLRTWWNNNKPSLSLNFSLKLPTLEIVWDTWSTMGKAARRLGLPGIPKFYVYWKYFENGGFPTPGSYFVAGENGVPEMLGTVGGRTAVASGAEITGIRDAVVSTGNQEIELLRQQNQLLMGILNKEFGITTDDIGKSARKYAQDYHRRTGKEAYIF